MSVVDPKWSGGLEYRRYELDIDIHVPMPVPAELIRGVSPVERALHLPDVLNEYGRSPSGLPGDGPMPYDAIWWESTIVRWAGEQGFGRG